ncbi:MAG: hypothetical protein WC655_05780 [Candidatus Hydrogenedentales bacterium]|jgi:hypothetical protein
MNEQTEQEARNLVARLYADWRWELKKAETMSYADLAAGLKKMMRDVVDQVSHPDVAAEAVKHFKVMLDRAEQFVTSRAATEVCPACHCQTCICPKPE